MAYEIRKENTFSFPKAKASKSKGYLSFIHELPSVLSGRSPVEAAHLSTANTFWMHYGRGKGTKAADRWCLPLTREEHASQHSFPGGEMAFWHYHQLNPHELATILWGAYCERGDEAVEWCIAKINQGLSDTGSTTREN